MSSIITTEITFFTVDFQTTLSDENNTSKGKEYELLLNTLNDEFAKRLTPVIATLGFLMVIGIVGNGLVVYVYWQWIKMKTTTKRIFILTLAHLDLTVCTIAIPFEIYDLRNQVLFQNLAVCKIARILEYGIVLASGFVLVSVSVERYVFLCKTFKKFSKRKAKVICIGCVIAAFVVGGPSASFAIIKKSKLEGMEIYGYECSMDSETEQDKVSQRVYYYFLSAIFLVCICVLIVIYSVIWTILRKHRKMSLRYTNSCNSLKIDRNELDKEILKADACVAKESRSGSAESTVTIRLRSGQKTSKSPVSVIVFFSVTVTFVVSFLPHIIVRFLMFFDIHLNDIMEKDASDLLYNFLIRSFLVGNVSNPFIYGILNKNFRHELKRCFERLYKRGKYEHRVTYLLDM